jgi:protein TonB
MFEQSFLNGAARTRKPWTVAVSFLSQFALVGLGVLYPLIRTEALPRASLLGRVFAPEAPRGRKPEPAPERPPLRQPPKPFRPGQLMQPSRIPDKVARIVDAPPALAAPGPETPGIPGGLAGAGELHPTLRRLLENTYLRSPAPPAEPVAPAKPIERVKVGGDVKPPAPIYTPKPVYPPIARAHRISGVVRLEAVIATDGAVKNLRLIHGHPLLAPAAFEAVRQWRYTPTLLNGDPVEVVMQVDVNFVLQ